MRKLFRTIRQVVKIYKSIKNSDGFTLITITDGKVKGRTIIPVEEEILIIETYFTKILEINSNGDQAAKRMNEFINS